MICGMLVFARDSNCKNKTVPADLGCTAVTICSYQLSHLANRSLLVIYNLGEYAIYKAAIHSIFTHFCLWMLNLYHLPSDVTPCCGLVFITQPVAI